MAPKLPKDPLIGRTALISRDATTTKGKPHPHAGAEGLIEGRTPNGRQYQIVIGDEIFNLPMDQFTVVGAMEPAANENVLALDLLVPSKTNREVVEDEELLASAATVKLYGILQPLLVRPIPPERLQDTFEDPATRRATHEIIAGERRYVMARIAGLRAVPVLIKHADGVTAATMQLVENIHRKNLNPLQEASHIQHLIDAYGLTREAVADAINMGRTHVFETLRLLNICPDAMAALKAGTLNRSLALLVAQRPTPELQVEFLKKVLTDGPDGGPMSHSAAKALAKQHYMTDLTKAPFDTKDADLVFVAGACTTCAKRTGANPELWDKAGTDVCTDTACFKVKKDAHYEQLTKAAQAKGRKVITGREARELMPTENSTPVGYLLLDKPTHGSGEPVRQLLGQDVPAGKVVLIETPSGAMVEAIPQRAAGAALEAKGKAEKPAKGSKPAERTAEEVQQEHSTRWRRRAVMETIEALKDFDGPATIPAVVACRYILNEARETDEAVVAKIFNLQPNFNDSELAEAVEKVGGMPLKVQLQALMMLACAVDLTELFDRPTYEARQLSACAEIVGVDIDIIMRQVAQEMDDEAMDRAAEANTPAAPPDQATPKLKPRGKGKAVDGTGKASKAEVMQGIAEAMQQAEQLNNFSDGQAVKIKTDIRGLTGDVLSTKGAIATIVRAEGRQWVVSVPDPWPFPGTAGQPMELTVDYTDLEAA
ncbi:ParB/RepB/Spo0J family partition protein [Acidovorax sp. LjRoot118]|uniref:ParB/RepB/Spo0J family partition protein n=1 Tax=Acidovorax sp. LjRoot118 TaxID=3342256 RepID=UPI003ECCEC1F